MGTVSMDVYAVPEVLVRAKRDQLEGEFIDFFIC